MPKPEEPTVHLIIHERIKRIACGVEIKRGVRISGDPDHVTCDACIASDDLKNFTRPSPASAEEMEQAQPTAPIGETATV